MSQSSARISIDLGSEKRRKLLEEFAKEKGMTLQDMVLLALREWLESQQEPEDLKAIREVENEPTRPIGELLAELGENDLLGSATLN